MKKTVLSLAIFCLAGLAANAQNPILRVNLNDPGIIPISYIPAAFMQEGQPGIAIATPDLSNEDEPTVNLNIYNTTFTSIGTASWTATYDEFESSRQGFSQNTQSWYTEDSWTNEAYKFPVVCVYTELGNSGIENASAFVVSQTLFNTNAAFEYILPRTELYYDTDYYNMDYNTDDYLNRDIDAHMGIYGLDIIDITDGSVVNTIMLPDGYYIIPYGDEEGLAVVAIVKLGNNYYMAFPAEKRSNDEDEDEITEILVYSLGQGNSPSSINRVDVQLPLSVFPTLVGRGNDITVEFGEGSNASQINVVNSLGQTVKTVPVQQGQRSVKVSTSNLSQGAHFITTRGNQTQKIIVR
ncbi:MAG: T9SS type A sorting domain-containing protein [Bacteroidales bacterium]|nr:T9SS type A sorting domain-containing protein [Bacteroidales bacterium]